VWLWWGKTEQIAVYQQRILEQRSRLGGVNASVLNNQLIARQIRLLENKLEKNLAKFNETVAKNRELRAQIDEHRRERVIFDGIYKKLERELHEKKKEMAAIIDDSKNAYQLRERAQSELQALKQHAEKEKSDFEQEFKELGELVRQQQLMLAQIRLQQFEAKQETDNTSIRSVEQLHEESQNRAQSIFATKDKAQLELSQEQLQSFETALQQIQEATGTHAYESRMWCLADMCGMCGFALMTSPNLCACVCGHAHKQAFRAWTRSSRGFWRRRSRTSRCSTT
jgi:hypothetical protein